MFEKIKEEAIIITEELIKVAKLQNGDCLVVGCSSSEICGDDLGTNSSLETAQAVFEAIYKVVNDKGINVMAQCCEHLNRAIILEEEVALAKGYEIVNVVPQPKAGGSFATTAYSRFKNPVAVERVKADAGIDIGQVLIGMQLKEVAVPVRLSINKIGEAPVVVARTRPKFIGGIRANYNEDLL